MLPKENLQLLKRLLHLKRKMMSLFSKKQIRPRLSTDWNFLLSMTHEEQDTWLKQAYSDKTMLDFYTKQYNSLVKELQDAKADFLDRSEKMDNAMSDLLKRNGELTEALNKVEIEAVKEVREEMRTETKNAANEKGMYVFDGILEIIRIAKG